MRKKLEEYCKWRMIHAYDYISFEMYCYSIYEIL